jgi:ABC-2 type transport system ATP-binding protein/lipopolysaccharide transport system ATP-binding protein
MATISLANVSIDIPVYDMANASIRKLILSNAVGGRFAQSGHHLVVNALKTVSFEARQGDRIGLVGLNGSGKTTLLRVLSGAYPPTAGSVLVSGDISPLIDLTLGMSLDSTGYENIRTCGIFWRLGRTEINDRLEEIAEFTELGGYLNMPIRTYSAGMLLRLAFAVATARDPDILLIDEVIGAGDASFFQKAFARFERLAQKSSIVVLATHAEAIVRKLCNKAIWLHKGSLMEYGEVNDVLKAYKDKRDVAEVLPCLADDTGRAAAI